MLHRRKRMILTSVKLCTSEARAQKHEWESSSFSRVAYSIFSHACTEIATFLAKTKQTKNVSQNIRKRRFCTNSGVIFNKATGARKPVKVLSASWFHSQKLKIEIRKNQKHGFIAREKWMLVSSYSFFITLQIFE